MLEKLRTHRRAFDLAAAAACVLLLCYAYYLQYYRGLDPCPLCIFQRIAVFGLGLAFLIAALPPAAWVVARRVATLLVVLAAAAGIGIAARHLYIQSLPPGSVPSCGAPLDHLWDILPVVEVLRKVFSGSGECAKVENVLGLSMPWWVLIWAAVLGVLGVLANWPARRRG